MQPVSPLRISTLSELFFPLSLKPDIRFVEKSVVTKIKTESLVSSENVSDKLSVG